MSDSSKAEITVEDIAKVRGAEVTNPEEAAGSEQLATVTEDMEGSVVFRVPMPNDVTQLKEMTPIVIKQPYAIDYLHSYGQDSPFFAGLTNGRLLGTRCHNCGYGYATPKLACMECGGECDWEELPAEGNVHCFTVCYFGSEEFLPECPFLLALVEFEGFDTLLLTRLVGLDPHSPSMEWVGMKVRPRFRRKAKLRPTDVYFLPA